jgi:hypothetical protein
MNFANSFLKDIKGNSSINQFGSKIKNMSQSFVPENTKDMLASAASSISNATATAATAATTSNTTTTASSNMTNSSSQSNQLRPGKSSQKIANSDSQMDARYSTSGVYSQSPSTSFQQPQQQQRIINPSQRVTRTESNNNDQFNNNNNNNTRSTSLQREPSSQFVPKQQQMYSSLETMSESSPYTNTYTNNNNNNNNKINQIDPMELEALKETNEALKSEVQRLSLFELKSKSLEKEVFNTKKIHSNSVTKPFFICFIYLNKEKLQINHFKALFLLRFNAKHLKSIILRPG